MSKKILVVDDEPDILKVVTFRLRKAGYHILEAVEGEQALQIIEKERPDLILLDLRIPVIDGYEVCKRIKSDDKTKDIPVIILTASVTRDMQAKVEELKADDYLVKPFDPAVLLTKVRNCIG
jgi:CheY-like chemotaxis protein